MGYILQENAILVFLHQNFIAFLFNIIFLINYWIQLLKNLFKINI